MLNDIASNTSFFGIFITGVAYVLACAIQKRFKASILNPLLVSCVILIIFMLVSGIDYNVYLYGKPKADGTYDGTGAIFFQNMLTPTTVCLAIPLYEKLVYLKKVPGRHHRRHFGRHVRVPRRRTCFEHGIRA